MSKTVKQKIKVVGYVRVSSVRGRGGESFISPTEQKRAIEDCARREGFELVGIYEELDVSGKRTDRPKWLEAIEMVKTGQVQGIVVWKFSRFARNFIAGKQAILEIEAVGGKVYSATESSDSKARDILMMVADWQIDDYREGFATARRSAVERGVSTARPNFGYMKVADANGNKKLVPHPVEAPVVIKLFEMRADGTSIADCLRYVESQGFEMSRTTIAKMFSRRAYLGEVSWGEGWTNTEAHEPLITEALFARVQAARGVKQSRRPDSAYNVAMLRGVIRCDGCGGAMRVNGRPENPGGRNPFVYECVGVNKGGCTAKARVKVAEIDAFIDQWMMDGLAAEDDKAEAFEAIERLEETRKLKADAEHAVEKIAANTEMASEFPDEWMTLMRNAKDKLAMADLAHAEAQNATAALDEVSLAEMWPTMPVDEKRTFLTRFLQEIRVIKGKQGIEDRCLIIGTGNIILNQVSELVTV